MSISQQTATEIIDTAKWLFGYQFRQEEKVWAPVYQGGRAFDVLRFIEEADAEGREIYAPEIAERLNIGKERARALVLQLRAIRRVVLRPRTRHGYPLTTLLTPEDLAKPWDHVPR
jgi:hypothetical protein